VISAESLAGLPSEGGRVVTIGKFDGIHLGHQALIRRTVELARSRNLASTVVTFDRHPSYLLSPDSVKREIIGPGQKHDLVKELRVQEFLQLTFDSWLANKSAEAFVQEVLVQELSVSAVVVGHDFRFGKGGLGTASLLSQFGEKHGFEVEVLEPVTVNGTLVSSSAIRELLELGDVATAAKYLGRNHSNRGLVEHGLKIGRKLGFPTANISRDAEGYLPLDGVYAGWMHDGENRYPTALSVGINETIQAVPRLVEAHVLDRTDLDLYEREVIVEYVDFIRPALKFDSVEKLISAIKDDLEQIKNVLK
jgi:riboflavin kinase/FMN adenylyltransferase